MDNPFLIPIVGIIMGCSIPMVILYLDYKKKRSIYELHHRERLAAIEKGLEVPPLPPEIFGARDSAKAPANYLLRSLIWLAVGGGMMLASKGLDAEEVKALGYIPLLIGAAYLIYYALEGRKLRAAAGSSGTSNPSQRS